MGLGSIAGRGRLDHNEGRGLIEGRFEDTGKGEGSFPLLPEKKNREIEEKRGEKKKT